MLIENAKVHKVMPRDVNCNVNYIRYIKVLNVEALDGWLSVRGGSKNRITNLVQL